jgi:hypothetical protein
MKERVTLRVTSVAMVAGLLSLGLTGSVGPEQAPISDTLAQRSHAGPVTAAVSATASAVRVASAAAARAAELPLRAIRIHTAYYDQLRARLHWVPIRFAGMMLKTPDVPSRLLLAKAAAQRANLAEVGLSYRDVYGIINAETSWVPRMGASKDGTPNLGIAQFEPATARAVGLTDPTDPVQAVHALALQLKDAARWSAHRIAGLKLTPQQYALKLREGVSIYYNLSTKGRNTWNGLNTAKLPIETRRHIANARVGAQEAGVLDAQLTELRARMGNPGVMTASYQQGQ